MASRAVAEAATRAVEPGRAHRRNTAELDGGPAARKVMTTSRPAPTSVIAARQRVSILPVRALSSGVVDLSSSTFAPSQSVADEIAASGGTGLDVRVIIKNLTGEGRIRVRQDRGEQFDSIGKGSMPLLNPWTRKLGGMHLNFAIGNSTIKEAYAALKPGGGDRNDWLHALQKNPSLLGGLGLSVEKLPIPVNKFENGKLVLGVTNLKVLVGGFVDAGFDLLLEDMNNLKVIGSANINIRGAAQGQLSFDNTGDLLGGSLSLAVTYKSFSGSIKVVYQPRGEVDVSGKAGYSSDKLSGEIQFVATDLDAANKFAKDAIAAAGGQQNVQTAAAPGPVPTPKVGQKKRALAATGQLGFNLTKWFAGTVNVVVDGKGAITVIGKIAPPGEIELFKQRDWDKEIFKLEAKAYYGIPVVGNLNLFANISLHAIAKLGPAKLYNIEILGTYSTDPEIQKFIQISGSLNISAYGGLRLRAEGGAGVEILEHNLKFGIGLNADVGVKAYADARPTIGYRDPGVFYISGVLDLVAQPILGLNGDFFIALETAWWSPLSDDRWTWPLFSKEWPLTDPIGISASVKDYVLGSGTVPEIELKKPEFDPSRFMTNMVDKTLPDKAGGPGAAQGKFKEDGSVAKPVVQPKKPAPKAAAATPDKKKAALKKGKAGAPDPKAANDRANSKILQQQLASLKSKGAMTRVQLDNALTTIKAKVSGISFVVGEKGAKWLVQPRAGGKTGKGIEIAAKVSGDTDKKPAADHVRKQIAMNGKTHTLEAIGEAGRIRVFMQTKRESLHDKLGHEARQWASFDDAEIKAAGQALSTRLAALDKREQALAVSYLKATDAVQRHALAVAGVDEIATTLIAIANEFGITIEDADVPKSAALATGNLNLGRATRAYVDPITALSLKKRTAAFQFAPGGHLGFPGRKGYAAGHLVADTFGGSNDASNLALISRGTNGKFSSRESRVRNVLRGTKKLPPIGTVLRYEVTCGFAAAPQSEIEHWLANRIAIQPGKKVAGVGDAILGMVASKSWDQRAIDKVLGLQAPQPLAFYDRLMWKVAYAYLPRKFTITITVRSGKPVDSDQFDNHIGGMVDAPT